MPDKPTPVRENQVVGVDLGVKVLEALSNGNEIIGSKASKKYEKQLKRLKISKNFLPLFR